MYKCKIVFLYEDKDGKCNWNYEWVDWDGLDNDDLECIINEQRVSEQKNLKEIVDASIEIKYAIVVECLDVTDGKYYCTSCECYFDKDDDGQCLFCGAEIVGFSQETE